VSSQRPAAHGAEPGKQLAQAEQQHREGQGDQENAHGLLQGMEPEGRNQVLAGEEAAEQQAEEHCAGASHEQQPRDLETLAEPPASGEQNQPLAQVAEHVAAKIGDVPRIMQSLFDSWNTFWIDMPSSMDHGQHLNEMIGFDLVQNPVRIQP